MRRSRRVRDLVAGAAAAAGLLGIVVGVPLALTAAVGWPLGRSVPSLDTVVTALRYGQIAPSTVLRLLAVVLWATWAISVISIAMEAAAVARGSVARALPGLGTLQAAAGQLVATLMLLSSMSTRALAAPPTSALPPPAASAQVMTAQEQPSRDAPVGDARRSPEGDRRLWTVRRRESLWTIAERALGDGRRWKDIAALNEGRTQPDGGRLRPGDTMIHPGWLLVLPSDAQAAEPPPRVTVAHGDDLWSIAAEHLDRGDRWREIYARNRGRRQPDGGRLTDPDLIRPGWVLRMPVGQQNAALDEDRDGPAVTDRTPVPDETADRGAPPTDGLNAHGTEPMASPSDGEAAGRGTQSGAAPAVAPPVTPSTLIPDDRVSEGLAGAAATTGRPSGDVAPEMSPTSQRAPSTAVDLGVATLGGAAVLAAGLVALIARRRRNWLRRRDVGAVLDPVDSEAAELERWLRSMAEHDLYERLDRVLRILTAHFAEHDVAPVVAAVELGEQVTLHLAEPIPAAPPGVTSTQEGRRWVLAPELEMAPAAAQRYVPVLASCGRSPSGALLLVNVLATGVLGIVASPAQAADALTSWAAELATGGASSGVEIVVVGALHPLIEQLPRVTIVADPQQALERVRRVTDDRDGAGFAAHVVVLYAAHEQGEMFAVLSDAADHPAVGLVVAGDRGAKTCLEVAGAHSRLASDGRWLDAPEWLTPQHWNRFGDLLRQPSRDHVPHPVPSPLLSVASVDPAEPATDVPLDADDAALTEVGVLGPLTFDGVASTVDADTAQLLTYLATHATGGHPEEVAAVLWPADHQRSARLACAGEAAEGTLGDAQDDPVVVHTDDGRIELSAAITTDLRRFHDLLRGLELQPPTTQARRLYSALALVRGQPFASGCDWAHAEGLATRTAGLVTDVAHRLAMQALSVGDVERAAWAVDRGLRAAPGCELLYRDRMRIADARGDQAALDACMHELQTCVEADDGWVTPPTVELYQQLRGGQATPPELRKDAS